MRRIREEGRLLKNLLLIIFCLLPSWAYSGSSFCEKSDVVILGKYKDIQTNRAPLLDMWSEVSGNLISIEIKSIQKFSQLVLDFQDDNKNVFHSKIFPISGNKISKLDLIKEIAFERKAVRFLSFKLFIDQKEFCHSVEEVIEKDAEGASNKTVERKK
jgi:hypothetical protein